jgi:hypothetical protein
MVAFANGFQRLNDFRPLPVGVFEDDSLLLSLAARFGLAASARSRVSGALNPDDLAIEVARLVDADTWDL